MPRRRFGRSWSRRDRGCGPIRNAPRPTWRPPSGWTGTRRTPKARDSSADATDATDNDATDAADATDATDGRGGGGGTDGTAEMDAFLRADGAAGEGWLAEWRLADACRDQGWAADEVLDAWRERDAAALAGQALSEPEVARELVAALPEGALLWCGNSLSVRDIDLLLSPRADTRVIASRGASGIDGTFSTAAGAALAHAADHPGAVAFALIGDLSLLHDAPGLSIGPGEPRPDLCVVVVNNDGGGIFEGLEPARFGGGVSGRDVPGSGLSDDAAPGGTRTGGPDADCGPAPLTVFERTFGTPHGASLERLAAAFGIPHTLAGRPGDVAKAIAATVSGTGPRIVEARPGRAATADRRARMRAAAISAAAAARG